MDRQEAGKTLNEVSHLIRERETALGILVAEERDSDIQVWNEAIALGHTQWKADKTATIAFGPKSIRILKLRGNLNALYEERDHLRFLVKNGLEGQATNAERRLADDGCAGGA